MLLLSIKSQASQCQMIDNAFVQHMKTIAITADEPGHSFKQK